MRKAYLEAIAKLTSQRDSPALARALVEILLATLPRANVELLGICNAANDKEFNEANVVEATLNNLLDPTGERRFLADEPALYSCITMQRRVADAVAKGARYILPVRGNRDTRALVVVTVPEALSPMQLGLVEYLVQIYSNQLFLLGKGEIDSLTGLLNRQALDDRMKHLLNLPQLRRRQDGDGICFAIIDIDYFKQVNDRYGHLYGDEVLLLFARLMTRCFRQCDLLFRYGGEEFAVILMQDLPTSLRILERFRNMVAAFEFPQIGHKTVSIGAVEINRQDLLSTVIDKADKALYYAKNHGRNQLSSYEMLREQGLIADAVTAGGEVELF